MVDNVNRLHTKTSILLIICSSIYSLWLPLWLTATLWTWVTAGYLPVHLIEVVGLLMTIQFYAQSNSLLHDEFRFLLKIDKIVAMVLGHMLWQWCFQGIRKVFGKWPLGVNEGLGFRVLGFRVPGLPSYECLYLKKKRNSEPYII
jgi:hypothetical protein